MPCYKAILKGPFNAHLSYNGVPKLWPYIRGGNTISE